MTTESARIRLSFANEGKIYSERKKAKRKVSQRKVRCKREKGRIRAKKRQSEGMSGEYVPLRRFMYNGFYFTATENAFFSASLGVKW